MFKHSGFYQGFLILLTGFMLVASPAMAGDRMAKNGDTVSIHYTGKLKDNSVFDSSKDRDPLVFELGTPNIIAGFNKAVVGMKAGESKTISIPPEEGYGTYDKKLVFEVPLKNLPAGVKSGAMLRNPQGHVVAVKEINGDKAVLDANHQLAGKTLFFDIKLVHIK